MAGMSVRQKGAGGPCAGGERAGGGAMDAARVKTPVEEASERRNEILYCLSALEVIHDRIDPEEDIDARTLMRRTLDEINHHLSELESALEEMRRKTAAESAAAVSGDQPDH